jgi:acyl carrier protein
MKLDSASLDMAARLDDAYGVTSMQAMRLLSELELELGIDIPEAEYKRLLTLNDVAGVCETYIRHRPAAEAEPHARLGEIDRTRR